jgi:hypothetical protein
MEPEMQGYRGARCGMGRAMMSEEAVVLRETTPMNILIVDDEPTIREALAARWRG